MSEGGALSPSPPVVQTIATITTPVVPAVVPVITNLTATQDVVMHEPGPAIVSTTPVVPAVIPIITNSTATQDVVMHEPDPAIVSTTPVVPVVPEVDMGVEPPALAPNTHACRNPHLPIITARARYRKPKEKNGAQMTRLCRQMRVNKAQDLADDIRDIRQALEDALPAVAAKHNIALRELRQRVYNGAGLKTKRKLSEYNAKVSCVMEIVNEGLVLGDRFNMAEVKKMIKEDPSLLTDVEPEHLEDMIAKLEARRVLERTGVRGDNVAAAIDAQRTLAILSELVTGLYKHTGIVGFAFFTRGNFSDITAPVAIHSGEALSFCAEMLNREPEVINAMLELWQIQRSSGAITAPSVEKMRVVGAAMIKSRLVQVTGKPNVVMNFENYVKSIVQGKHVALVGWPAGVPWKRLAKQSNTGDVRRIYKALKDGTMKWKRLRTEEEEEEEERRFNKLINKGLATVGKKRKVRDDLGATHQTQGRELESDAEDGAQGSGDDGDNDGEPSDDEDRPFVDYDGGYSDDNTARRKKAPAKSKSTKASATKTTKAAASKSTTKTTKAVASKSTKSAASKSTAKTTPKSTAPKPKPPAKPSTKSKAALKPFVPTEAPPKYIFKNGKHVPNGAAVDEHARRMVEERGKHERQMRELKGGNESGSDEGSDDDDEGEEQVVSTKQGPPAKRRRTTKEPEEQAVKKRKKTVDKRARDDSQDEDEQPVAKKAKLVVELPRPRPAWNSAPNATRGKRVGPPGVRACDIVLPEVEED
ncbi:hypothetical protein FB45DRAFT_1066126 [Roridomyces roridus]|uniref:Uncharacterized protein n=1 Tax=Roridomyces roridus TaxID=1738132 RepID=A0AAD7B535_9AGAR|nr:hypothetical protein FB45DRAFT_1066126 [Roridomyces roridus]